MDADICPQRKESEHEKLNIRHAHRVKHHRTCDVKDLVLHLHNTKLNPLPAPRTKTQEKIFSSRRINRILHTHKDPRQRLPIIKTELTRLLNAQEEPDDELFDPEITQLETTYPGRRREYQGYRAGREGGSHAEHAKIWQMRFSSRVVCW
jgi:hypothetical protein